jgi:predicted O-methyltransferase YrrM
MSKKVIVGLAGMTLLLAVGLLMAQPGAGGGRRPMGGPMGQWLDDLEKAHEQKNMDRIGELIEQMKQRRQQFQARPGQGRPMGPPQGTRGPGGGGFRPQGDGQVIRSEPPTAGTAFEKKVLAVLDDMDRNQRRGNMNVPVEDGRLLRLLAEAVGAKRVVEIGTSNGYSGIWQALALKATGGKLTTFEIDARRAAMARQNFEKAGIGDVVTLVEGDAHEKVGSLEGPIDILFLDADKEGYIDYLNKLLPKLRPGGLIVAHNINPRQADPKYVEAITSNPDLETLILNHTGGVSVTLKKRGVE